MIVYAVAYLMKTCYSICITHAIMVGKAIRGGGGLGGEGAVKRVEWGAQRACNIG